MEVSKLAKYRVTAEALPEYEDFCEKRSDSLLNSEERRHHTKKIGGNAERAQENLYNILKQVVAWEYVYDTEVPFRDSKRVFQFITALEHQYTRINSGSHNVREGDINTKPHSISSEARALTEEFVSEVKTYLGEAIRDQDIHRQAGKDRPGLLEKLRRNRQGPGNGNER